MKNEMTKRVYLRKDTLYINIYYENGCIYVDNPSRWTMPNFQIMSGEGGMIVTECGIHFLDSQIDLSQLVDRNSPLDLRRDADRALLEAFLLL